MSLLSLPCRPDLHAMHEHVQRLFTSPGLEGLVEISWTSPHAPHKLKHAQLFELDALDELVDHASRINATANCNLYISAGLRAESVSRVERASDNEIVALTACWADFDKPAGLTSAIDVAQRLGIPPNIIVHTGREPHLRGQLWWVLEEPWKDLTLHKTIQRALAQRLGGDPSVVNPSRVMRLGGSVAWPLKQGRTLEMTAVDHDTEVRQPPYSFDEVVSALRRAGALETEQQTATVLDFSRAEPSLDVDDLITRAAAPGCWHNSALKLTAHLLGRGTPPDVVVDLLCSRLQQPGYTYLQTRAELATMVTGGVARGFAAVGQAAPAIEPASDAPTAESPFKSIDDMLDAPTPEWLIKDYLPERCTSALFAPSGAFKSFLAVDMAMSVAYGLPWHRFETVQKKTLYILSEGKAKFAQRLAVWQQIRASGRPTDQFHLLPVAVNLLDPACVSELISAIEKHLGGVGFIIIDTLARNFGDGDENATKDMNKYVNGVTRLSDCGAHVMTVHHTGKDSSRDERGSSALRSGVDVSLKLERDERSDIATLKVRKQKDEDEAPPLTISFPKVEGVHPKTGEVITSRVATLAERVVETRKSGGGLSKEQLRIVELVRSGMGSPTLLTTELGVHRQSIFRSLKRLEERGVLAQDENAFWRVVNHQETQVETGD